MTDHAALFDLSDQVAVVTGAGRGIGEGIARVLAGAGAAIVCAARRTEEIERVAAEIRAGGGRAIAQTTDVTDDAQVEALAKRAVGEYGRLDVWVNNAGGSPVQARLGTRCRLGNTDRLHRRRNPCPSRWRTKRC